MSNSVDDWRKDLLEVLEYLTEDFDDERVYWVSAGDEHVCPLCTARNGNIYTIEEAKKELEGEFCKPGDPDDRCRCTFLPVIDE